MEATSGMMIDGADNDCRGERATEARPDRRGLTTHRLPAALFDDLYTSTEKRDLFIGTIAALPPFLLVVGGLDDAMLAVSAAAERSARRHVLLCTPEEDECMDFLRRIDDVESVSLVPYPESVQNRQALVSVAKSLPSCRGMGFTAFDAEYAGLFTDPERQSFAPTMKLLPITAVSPERERATKRIVVHAHNICVPVHRSERPIINPRWWERIMSVCTSFETEVVITGDPELASAYPAPEGARDMRGASRREQRALISSADVFVSSDCPELVIAAFGGASCIHCTPLRGYDLEGIENHRHRHVYHRFADLRRVDTADDADVALVDAARDRDIRQDARHSFQVSKVECRTTENPRRVGDSALTSFHPVFTDRSYRTAKSVLIKSSTAVGDSLITTAVIRELQTAHPDIAIDVSAPPHILDLYRTLPYVRRLYRRGSAEELAAEAVADEVVEYNFIVDRFPEYYHGIHLYDILGNIAGVRMRSKDLAYASTEEELRRVHDVIDQKWNSLTTRMIVCTQFETNTDAQRSYPHGRELTIRLLECMPSLCIVNVGTSLLGISHERFMECAEVSGWGLRDHLAAVSICDKAIMIDSSFLHVAHNLWRKPTLMIESITRRELVVDTSKRRVLGVRNVGHACTACYWQSPPCKRDCLRSLLTEMLLPDVIGFLLDEESDIDAPSMVGIERPLAFDDASQSIARVFYENVHRRELITPVIRVTPDMPAYVRAWNGVRVEDAIENHQGVTDVRTAESTDRVAQPVAQTTTATAGSLSGAVVWS